MLACEIREVGGAAFFLSFSMVAALLCLQFVLLFSALMVTARYCSGIWLALIFALCVARQLGERLL